jgi:hypothetical protein
MLSVDLTSLDALLAELGDRAEAAARPAAQAAAQVLYQAVVANVDQLGRVTGNLRNSIYQVFSQDNSSPGHATYHVSWNHRKAPHGGLVEFGYIQRYQVRVGKGGRWYTVVRPGKQGTPKPRRNASQAEKDAYYVPLSAPRQVAAKAFVRNAARAFPAAEAAAKAKLLDEIV